MSRLSLSSLRSLGIGALVAKGIIRENFYPHVICALALTTLLGKVASESMPTSGFNCGIVTGKGLVGVEGITLIAEGDGEEVAVTRQVQKSEQLSRRSWNEGSVGKTETVEKAFDRENGLCMLLRTAVIYIDKKVNWE